MVRGSVQEQGMRRFYIQTIVKPQVHIQGGEARHMLRVLRMKEGDSFILFDGSGTDYPCRIERAGGDELIASVGEGIRSDREPAVCITLYQAVLKKDNMDLVLQKGTELGIAGFVPLLSARCVKRPDDPGKMAVHLEKTAREAAKQCGRSQMPDIGKLIELNELKEHIKKHELMLLAYENEEVPLKAKLAGRDFSDIGIIIGPEGGFEPEEVKALADAGAAVCGLGKLTLRAETAAIAAVAMILYEKTE
jgi:16S rRNA (uracil1498-N3)-methyltransferase